VSCEGSVSESKNSRKPQMGCGPHTAKIWREKTRSSRERAAYKKCNPYTIQQHRTIGKEPSRTFNQNRTRHKTKHGLTLKIGRHKDFKHWRFVVHCCQELQNLMAHKRNSMCSWFFGRIDLIFSKVTCLIERYRMLECQHALWYTKQHMLRWPGNRCLSVINYININL
jgi:hypothetical protein